MEMLVSVIIPAFNAEKYISATLQSVLSQTHRDIQVIVVDDCSSDNTITVIEDCAKRDDRIELSQTDQNSGGPARPRNIALSKVRGDYVAFLDADDLWRVDKLRYQLEKMSELKLDFSATGIEPFSDGDEETFASDYKEHESNGAEPLRLNHELLLRKNIIANSSVVLTSKLAARLRFSEAQQHIAIEDYIAWLELHQKPALRSLVLAEKLTLYRRRRGSISASKYRMARRIYQFLGEYKIAGKPLGMKRFYYFAHYVLGSLTGKLYARH